MEVMLRVAAAAVTAAVLSAVLRKTVPELALVLALAAGLWMVGAVSGALGEVVELLKELTALTGLEDALLRPVVKTVAISLITRLTAQLCRGAGEGGLAAFAELAGTALALGVSLPLVRAVMLMMGELLG